MATHLCRLFIFAAAPDVFRCIHPKRLDILAGLVHLRIMNEKVAVITGASSGIGRAAADKFARNGWNVVAVGRNESELLQLKEEKRDAGGSIKIHVADVLEATQVERMLAESVETFGRIDALVNSAGVIKSGNIETTTMDEWNKMLDINLTSVFRLMQKCVPHLEQTGGSIINVSSVTGLRSFPGVLAYCVSKAAVDQLTRCAALELGSKGIRVNAVNPGVVVTNLHKRGGMSDEDYAAFIEHARDTHPLGRAGQAEEVAELVYFLASEKAEWITGVTYSIDGGRAQTCAR